MNVCELIYKKRNGKCLTKQEIEYIIRGYTDGRIPDYQMSAFLMAIYFRGMNFEETYYMTIAMRDSGDHMSLDSIKGLKIDKHSTGGVGDKTTLVLGPIVAACGVKVAKMSGRGLGFTGGTIDKLESIPGFQTAISEDEFIKNVNEINIALSGQTANLAPADKKIYALRDVTATVDQLSLIASSIMSKKLASGADGIVLDVKTGDGAFMKNEEDAIKLAKEMIRIGESADKKMAAFITGMNQPLGYAIGNALEVKEAIEVLNGKGPKDVLNLCIALGSEMVYMAKQASDRKEAEKKVKKMIASKKAFQKFREWVQRQGGDIQYVDCPEKLIQAKYCMSFVAEKEGMIEKIHCESIGEIVLNLGGGRLKKDMPIDPDVGIVLLKKIGEKVQKGECLAKVYGNDEKKTKEAVLKLNTCIEITQKEMVKKVNLIHEWMTSSLT